MFFLVKGAVELVADVGTAEEVACAVMTEGSYFGELALLLGVRRSTSARVLEHSNLFVLNKVRGNMIPSNLIEKNDVLRLPGAIVGLYLSMRAGRNSADRPELPFNSAAAGGGVTSLHEHRPRHSLIHGSVLVQGTIPSRVFASIVPTSHRVPTEKGQK